MRFLVDEGLGLGVSLGLADLQHDVASVRLDSPGLADPEGLRQAVDENRILITYDQGYGNLVLQQGLPHAGIILLRMPGAGVGDKIAALIELLELYPHRLAGNFTVTTGRKIRIVEPEVPNPGAES